MARLMVVWKEFWASSYNDIRLKRPTRSNDKWQQFSFFRPTPALDTYRYTYYINCSLWAHAMHWVGLPSYGSYSFCNYKVYEAHISTQILNLYRISNVSFFLDFFLDNFWICLRFFSSTIFCYIKPCTTGLSCLYIVFFLNIARGTTDPCYRVRNWILFGHQD